MSDLNKFLRNKRKEEEKAKKNEIYDYLVEYFLPQYSIKKEQFFQWFEGYLKNYIYKNEIDIYNDDGFRNKLLHTIDYLNSPYSKKRFDRMTWEVAEKQVANWELTLEKRKELGDDPEGVLLISELSDNWTAVELTTPKSLSYEGGVMGHCVGTYSDKVVNGYCRIFSLRDKKDNSHITVEYSTKNNRIIQIQGKQNQFPVEKHRKYLAEFLSENKFLVDPYIIKRLNIHQVGWEFHSFSNENEKNNYIINLINSGYEEGGVLFCDNIQLPELSGVWDNITISNSKIEKVASTLSTKELKIESSEIELFEEGIECELLKVSHLKGDQPSYIKAIHTDIRNVEWENIPLIKSDTLCIKDIKLEGVLNPLFIKEKTIFNNFIGVNELPEGFYGNLELTNTTFENISEEANIQSLTIVNTPIKKIDLSKIKSISAKNIDINNLSGYQNEEKCFIYLEDCENLKEVTDINAPNLFIKLENCKNLEKVSNIKANNLSLRGSNVKFLEKVSCNSLNLYNTPEDIEMRRNRVKKLITNKKRSIRNRSNQDQLMTRTRTRRR